MRSLLIAPADEKRLAEALMSGADAVIVDLAGAAPAERAGARTVAARFLKEARGKRDGPVLIVRANALEFGRDRFRSRRGDGWRARRDSIAREPRRRQRPTAFRQACGARGRSLARRRRDENHRGRRHRQGSVRHGFLSRLERPADRYRLERRILTRRYRRRDRPRPFRRSSRPLSPGARLDASRRNVSGRGGARRSLPRPPR